MSAKENIYGTDELIIQITWMIIILKLGRNDGTLTRFRAGVRSIMHPWYNSDFYPYDTKNSQN